MLASAFSEFGGPEVLRTVDLPEPVAGPGEVVVRVAASTLNPTDLLMREGRQVALMKGLAPPWIAGMEFAGHIHALGEPTGDAGGLQVGDAVMGLVNPRRPQGGSHAQFIVVPAVSVVALDPATDLVEASTVPMNALTAKLAMDALALPPGSTLLVTGAAGAVGGYVMPLARLAGLRVIGDAKESDVALVRQLGAHEVVPRGEAMAEAVRRLCPAGVDGLVDAALVGATASALVRDGGAAVSLRRSNPIEDPRLRAGYVNVLDAAADSRTLQWLAELYRDGTLVPRVAVRLPMSRAEEGHRLLEKGGLRGRVVLTFE